MFQRVSPHPHLHTLNRKSVLLVALCTLSGAAAQIFMKLGANNIVHPTLMQLIMNVPLMTGYALYGVNMLMLTIALKNAPLSLLYPIISLTYVWVTMLSVMIFKESVNRYKVAGLAIVILGVAVLGLGGKQISDAENQALDEISSALGPPPAS